MSQFPTLIKPPPLDPSKSQIEGLLELTQLEPIDPVRNQTLENVVLLINPRISSQTPDHYGGHLELEGFMEDL
jgi:hypothetical protein